MKKILISLLIATSISNSSLWGMEEEQENDATNYPALSAAAQYLRTFENAECTIRGYQQDLETILKENSALSEEVQTARNQISQLQELINTTKQGQGYQLIEARVNNSTETADQKNVLLELCKQIINTSVRQITEESEKLNALVLQITQKAYPEEPESQNVPAPTFGTLPTQTVVESVHQEETNWNISLPRLTFKKKGGFSSLFNLIWPQIPSLRIVDKQHVKDATKHTKKLATRANNYLAQTSSRENLHVVNVAAENSPAQALALHKQATKHWLTTAPTRFSANNLLTTIHTARTWRLCLSAATAIGFGAHQVLKNMKFSHPRMLAIPCAAIAFFAAKPIFGAVNRAILTRTYRDDANEAVRKQYIAQLRDRNLLEE